MTHPLRRYRQEAGLTLAELAERAGLTKGTLSRIETGVQYPSFPAMVRIMEATGGALKADDFLPRSSGVAA